MLGDRSPGQGPCSHQAVAGRSAAPLAKRPPCAGVPQRCGTPRLATLPHVQAMTARAWATTSPPSSRPHTGMCVSYNVGEAVWEFPSASPTDTPQPLAASSTPGGWGTTPPNVRTWQALHRPRLGLGCRSPLHSPALTTLPTEVPHVSLGHRMRAVSRVWLAGAALFFTGFRPQEVPATP
jgi:hypothetical protein